MRIAASILFAVVVIAAVGVATREPSDWHPPSEETLGNTAVSVRTARARLGGEAGESVVRTFGAEAIAPALTGTGAGTMMPSAASALP